MIYALLVKYSYFLIVLILTLLVVRRYYNRSICNKSKCNNGVFFLVLLLALLIGFRPPVGKLFVDMGNYISFYTFIYEGAPFKFDFHAENLLFDNLFACWWAMRLGYTSFFVLIAFIYFGSCYLGIRRLFPHDTLIAYLVFLGAFSTFSYATNGIKAGAAASLFIWALGYRDNLKICIPIILLSWGFHHSMQLPVAAFLLTIFFKKPSYYYYAWLFCFFIAALHISYFQNLFGGMTDSQGAGYLNYDGAESDGTKGGFRIDFIIYSMVPIIMGYIIEMKKKIHVSEVYRSLIHLYVCCNGIWMLCMYASFTNRIAYLSWFLYPIVLIYPYLKENINSCGLISFKKVVYFHLGFTLFMDLFFYGGIKLLLN